MAASIAFSLYVGDYQVEPDISLGAGSDSSVYLAIHLPTEARVAVKIINITSPQKHERAIYEARMHKKLSKHEYIIDIRDIVEERDFMYIFLEFAPNGHLGTFIHRHGRLEEDVARRFFIQMLNALEHCHKHNIVHHDIKLENLMLSADLSIRLIDFGLSKRVTKGSPITEFSGSPLYMPPEIFALQPHNESVDIWSLGVCLYYMVTDAFPFPADTFHELEEKVLFEDVIFPVNMGISDNLQDLIRSMLEKDPLKRITAYEIKNHSWLSSSRNYTMDYVRKSDYYIED